MGKAFTAISVLIVSLVWRTLGVILTILTAVSIDGVEYTPTFWAAAAATGVAIVTVTFLKAVVTSAMKGVE